MKNRVRRKRGRGIIIYIQEEYGYNNPYTPFNSL
jgi:hypothetical protein